MAGIIAKLRKESVPLSMSSGEYHELGFSANSVKAFHQMKKYYGAIDDNASALQLTNHTSWLKRFNNESVHYVGLFMDIIEQAAFLTAGEAVQWEMVPGYTQLLYAFLFQLKHKMNLNEWKTRAVSQCLYSLMQNPRIFNVLIQVLFSKTNVNDAPLTEISLDILTEWFARIRSLYTYLPAPFDYNYFFQGLSILLECEHHVTLIRGLTFIYSTMHMYMGKQRRLFLHDIIFKQCFFKLFLHWHPQVRSIYHQLILFKGTRVREEYKRMRMKDVNVSREKQTDRLVRGLREGYVGVVKKRIEWSEQKREEISRSLPQSPSAFLKTLKKSKVEEPEAEDTAKATNGKKEKKKEKKEKEEMERIRRKSGELASSAGKRERLRNSFSESLLTKSSSKLNWRKKKERKEQENGPQGYDSDDDELSQGVAKVNIMVGDTEFPSSLETYAGLSLLKYEETAENWAKWASAVEMLPDGSVHYPDIHALISTPKADAA